MKTTDLASYAALLADVLRDLTPTTRTAYEKDLRDFTTTFLKTKEPVAAVARLLRGDFSSGNQLVRDYRQQMDQKRDLSSSTINRRLSMLRKIVQAARRRDLIPWTLDVPNVKDEAVLTRNDPDAEDMIRIVAYVAKDESPRGRRAYAIIRLMADLGLRRGAVVNLDFSDMRLPRQIRVKLKGREKKRWKTLPPATLHALRRWLDVHPFRSRHIGPVFVNLVPGKHTRLSGSAVYELVTEFSEAAGCRTRPHGIRHTAITNAIVNAVMLGETLDSVMQFSDHSDFRMVLRYRKASMQAQKKFSNKNAETFGDPFAMKPGRHPARAR